MQTLPPTSSPSLSPLLQASKWNCIQALLSLQELKSLLEHLEHPSIYICGSMWPKNSFPSHDELFLDAYAQYIDNLSEGLHPPQNLCRTYFSACLDNTGDAAYIQDVQNDQYLLRTRLPIVQVQHHTMSYSPFDGKMHSMVFGKDAITWGVQFSYPQMYMDKSGNVFHTNEGTSHPNSQLFKSLQRWLRHNALPTTFVIDGQKCATAIRIGRECLPWIHLHPQLAAQNIQISQPS